MEETHATRGIVAVQTNDQVVSASEYQALLKRVKQLEQMLGRKTVEAEILKDALEIATAKKFISPIILSPPDSTRSDK